MVPGCRFLGLPQSALRVARLPEARIALRLLMPWVVVSPTALAAGLLSRRAGPDPGALRSGAPRLPRIPAVHACGPLHRAEPRSGYLHFQTPPNRAPGHPPRNGTSSRFAGRDSAGALPGGEGPRGLPGYGALPGSALPSRSVHRRRRERVRGPLRWGLQGARDPSGALGCHSARPGALHWLDGKSRAIAGGVGCSRVQQSLRELRHGAARGDGMRLACRQHQRGWSGRDRLGGPHRISRSAGPTGPDRTTSLAVVGRSGTSGPHGRRGASPGRGTVRSANVRRAGRRRDRGTGGREGRSLSDYRRPGVTKRMDILFVSRCLPGPIVSGARVILHHVAHQLRSRGHNLDLLGFHLGDAESDPSPWAEPFRYIEAVRERPRSPWDYLLRL